MRCHKKSERERDVYMFCWAFQKKFRICLRNVGRRPTNVPSTPSSCSPNIFNWSVKIFWNANIHTVWSIWKLTDENRRLTLRNGFLRTNNELKLSKTQCVGAFYYDSEWKSGRKSLIICWHILVCLVWLEPQTPIMCVGVKSSVRLVSTQQTISSRRARAQYNENSSTSCYLPGFVYEPDGVGEVRTHKLCVESTLDEPPRSLVWQWINNSMDEGELAHIHTWGMCEKFILITRLSHMNIHMENNCTRETRLSRLQWI